MLSLIIDIDILFGISIYFLHGFGNYRKAFSKLHCGMLMTEFESEDIELVFPKRGMEEGLQEAGIIDELMEKIKLDNLMEKFKGYKVDSIELNINGVAKSSGITSLIVSFEGSGGCKIVLKPKD